MARQLFTQASNPNIREGYHADQNVVVTPIYGGPSLYNSSTANLWQNGRAAYASPAQDPPSSDQWSYERTSTYANTNSSFAAHPTTMVIMNPNPHPQPTTSHRSQLSRTVSNSSAAPPSYDQSARYGRPQVQKKTSTAVRQLDVVYTNPAPIQPQVPILPIVPTPVVFAPVQRNPEPYIPHPPQPTLAQHYALPINGPYHTGGIQLGVQRMKGEEPQEEEEEVRGGRVYIVQTKSESGSFCGLGYLFRRRRRSRYERPQRIDLTA